MSVYEEFDVDTAPPSRRRVLIPAILSMLAFGGGAWVGTAFANVRAAETKVVVHEAPPPVDLDAACAPRIRETAEALHAATGKVDGLSAQVDAKLQEVTKLQAEIASSKKASSDQRRRLAAAKAELAGLRLQLNSAETDKLNLTARVASLTTNLTERELDLDHQKAATARAETAAVDASWSAFDRGAQMEICDKGSRNALGKCRQSVKAHLAKIEDDYKSCVRAGAANPTVREATEGELLPEFSQWLGQEDRVTKGWYAMLCDPTLPEAMQAADGASMAGSE